MKPSPNQGKEGAIKQPPPPGQHQGHQGESPATVKLVPEGDYIPAEPKYDCCAFLIFCPAHQTVVLSRATSGGHQQQQQHNTTTTSACWLPFTPLPVGKMWEEGAVLGACLVLTGGDLGRFEALKAAPPFTQPVCMQVLRVQMPHTLGFITRLIYYIELTGANSGGAFRCCTNSGRLKWHTLTSLTTTATTTTTGESATAVAGLWGPEAVDFAKQIAGRNGGTGNNTAAFQQEIAEYSLEEAFLYVPRDPPRNLEESMLKSIHITEKDVERLYADFLDHCFPSFYMAAESFRCYMAKYGFERADARMGALFRSFNYHKNGYLSFHELLIGLATIEPGTIHGESRVRFIFRYYDADGSGSLSEEEFRALTFDLLCCSGGGGGGMKPGAITQQMLAQKTAEGMRAIGTRTVNGTEQVTMADFNLAIGSRKFRGTSNLCRAKKPIFNQISRQIAARTLKKLTARSNMGSVVRAPTQGECPTCKEKEYTLSMHSVKIEDGRVVDPILVMDRPTASPDVLSAALYSVDFVFNRNSVGNILLRLVHQFNAEKGTNKEPKGLLADRPDAMWQLVLALHAEMDLLLTEEDKCPRTFSPCYIVGDIHGNLEDLLSLEKALWRRVPCVAANYLFLGDYVDRGAWGLECALYLMAFKLLCPNKVTLLRGNHEVRALQANYSYKRECTSKYGEEVGLKIWETTNQIFDKLPVAAVVDDAIYCAHGGIPRSASTIAALNALRKELPNPEVDAAAAWEILWSDPCHAQQFNEICNYRGLNPATTGGYVFNIRRGTAFLFNEVGANGFLAANGLTHIVRAHEVPQRGYTFHFGNKCVTIFSCSHYCGNDNPCSVILADSQVLRVIRLDTVNNAPATD